MLVDMTKKKAKTKPKTKKKQTKKVEKDTYDASKIVVLEGLEAVRKRPAMYVGDTAEMGLHQILKEVIDNSIDEALAGFCDKVDVIVHKDGSVTVVDNGRGIPVGKHPQTGKSALETAMCTLHAGGKFEEGAYKVSGGLHGVGVSCTNALSALMVTTVRKDGKTYQQKYKRGKAQANVKELGKMKRGEETGTTQYFKPDPNIFSVLDYNTKTINTLLRQQAFLNAAVTFTFTDEREEKSYTNVWHFDGGVKSYVQYMTLEEKSLSRVFYMSAESDDVTVEVALRYTDGVDSDILPFTNNIFNGEGGTHLSGFKAALTKEVNNYAVRSKIVKDKKDRFSGEDVKEGLVAVLSVKVPDPQFEGQTKIKLNNISRKA